MKGGGTCLYLGLELGVGVGLWVLAGKTWGTADVSAPYCRGLSLASALGLVLITWGVKATTLDSWTRELGGFPSIDGGQGWRWQQWIKSGDWTLVPALPLTAFASLYISQFLDGRCSEPSSVNRTFCTHREPAVPRLLVSEPLLGSTSNPGPWWAHIQQLANATPGSSHGGKGNLSPCWVSRGQVQGGGEGGGGQEAKMNQRKSLPRATQSKRRMVMWGSKFLRSLIPALPALSAHLLPLGQWGCFGGEQWAARLHGGGGDRKPESQTLERWCSGFLTAPWEAELLGSSHHPPCFLLTSQEFLQGTFCSQPAKDLPTDSWSCRSSLLPVPGDSPTPLIPSSKQECDAGSECR